MTSTFAVQYGIFRVYVTRLGNDVPGYRYLECLAELLHTSPHITGERRRPRLEIFLIEYKHCSN
jgi:hypothetical protein